LSFAKKLTNNWKIVENVIFVIAFGLVMYKLVSEYWYYIHDSVKGKGYISAILGPFATRDYYMSAVAAMIIVNTTLILFEVISFVTRLFRQYRGNAGSYRKYKFIFKKLSVTYKPSFLAMLIHEILPKLILINMFWIWLPSFQKFAPFVVGLQWYCWIYAYVCWELSAWVYHFTSHRVRVLWCLHAPHHAPSEINMSVNWVHFFAEGYYSTLIHLVVLTLFGVNPLMFLAIMSIDSAWGVFTHISEHTLKDGKLGILQHFVITPAHHRVHHAKNPLYIDTNFAFVLPVWDWIFGTLQPLKEEVKVDYGVTRELDVTNFADLYFGEILLLYRDVKNAAGIKNKLSYIIMPPGWTPWGAAKTASALRQDFLKTSPELGVTSRNRFLTAIKSRFKTDRLEVETIEMSDSTVA